MDSIQHLPEASRFQIPIGDDMAVADYRIAGDEILFTHTFVPPAARGKGIAEALVRTALAFAREQKLQPVPVCSYVQRFMERHPEL